MAKKGKTGGRAKRGGRRVVRKRNTGGSAFTDFFTKTIPGAAKKVYGSVLKPAYNWAHDTHIPSTLAALIPHPAGKAGAIALRAAGLGRARGMSQTGGLNSLHGRLYLV